MKYRFVGDIHGKVDVVKRALDYDGRVVFVGDFIDSYDKTVTEHDECFRLVIEAIRSGKAKACYGNHELSYLMPDPHRCSGYEYHRSVLMRKYESDIGELFDSFIIIGDTLISHAGLTNQMWQEFSLTKENFVDRLNEWWADPKSPMHYIGRYRGGRAPYGGLFWCDFTVEFQSIEGLKQIFGHTRGRDIRMVGNSYCIDCQDFKPTFLELEIE